MNAQRFELRLPDLGLDGIAVLSTCWLVPRGAIVMEGDRLIEVLAGEVTVDLAAPTSGTLVERCVGEDQRLETGQLLGVIER